MKRSLLAQIGKAAVKTRGEPFQEKTLADYIDESGHGFESCLKALQSVWKEFKAAASDIFDIE